MLDRTYFKISLPLHISCTIWHRDIRLVGWMCHHQKACHVLKPGHRDLLFTLDCIYFKIPFTLHISCTIWHRDIKLEWMDASLPKGVSRTKTRSLWPTFHAWLSKFPSALLTIWHRDTKLDGWMHHRPKVCRVLKPGHRDLLFMLESTYFKIPFRCRSPLLFDIKNIKLDGWMGHCPKVCRIPKPGHRDLLFMLDRTYFKIPFPCIISPVLFDIGTSNLMGGCIIAQRCFAYQNQVIVTYFLLLDRT